MPKVAEVPTPEAVSKEEVHDANNNNDVTDNVSHASQSQSLERSLEKLMDEELQSVSESLDEIKNLHS